MFRFSAGIRDFLLFKRSKLALGSTQLPLPKLPGTLSPGIKQPSHEATH